jgi:hypothetical protein
MTYFVETFETLFKIIYITHSFYWWFCDAISLRLVIHINNLFPWLIENDSNLSTLVNKLHHHDSMHSHFSKNENVSFAFYFKNQRKINAKGKACWMDSKVDQKNSYFGSLEKWFFFFDKSKKNIDSKSFKITLWKHSASHWV